MFDIRGILFLIIAIAVLYFLGPASIYAIGLITLICLLSSSSIAAANPITDEDRRRIMMELEQMQREVREGDGQTLRGSRAITTTPSDYNNIVVDRNNMLFAKPCCYNDDLYTIQSIQSGITQPDSLASGDYKSQDIYSYTI